MPAWHLALSPARTQADNTRRMAIYAVFAVCYAIMGHQWYTTIGDPHRHALAQIDSLR